MNEKLKCPCCEKHHFMVDNNFEQCPVCGWLDDGVQRDHPDLGGCGNTISLNEYRVEWQLKTLIPNEKELLQAVEGFKLLKASLPADKISKAFELLENYIAVSAQ